MREAFRSEQGDPIVYQRVNFQEGKRRVELRFAFVEGRVVCIGIEIGPRVLPGNDAFIVVDDAELDPIRATEMRRIRWQELVDKALEWMIVKDEEFIALDTQEAAKQKERIRPHNKIVEQSRKTPGRPRLYDDDHYRQVAAIYEKTLRSGRRDPLRAIMDELKIEKTAAASKVREARRRGFLTMDYFGGEKASG